MNKTATVLIILCFALTGFGKFKTKNIKPKKADQFQSRTTASGVTFAADLLIKSKEQKKYFEQSEE